MFSEAPGVYGGRLILKNQLSNRPRNLSVFPRCLDSLWHDAEPEGREGEGGDEGEGRRELNVRGRWRRRGEKVWTKESGMEDEG